MSRAVRGMVGAMFTSKPAVGWRSLLGKDRKLKIKARREAAGLDLMGEAGNNGQGP